MPTSWYPDIELMLATSNDDLQGKVCLVSGSGNVAQYTVEKLNELGAKPVTMSDSNNILLQYRILGQADNCYLSFVCHQPYTH